MNRALPIALALLVGACANIRFESGPYAIRALEVVYSAQEDVTFFSWRLRKDAKLSLVDFELWLDGDYVAIDLDDAPFAAQPWACGDTWCFQYQVSGEYEGPETSPMRSVHRDDGVFMGPAERSRRVATTFTVDPIALGKNDAIDPRRFDWFADNDVPLVRQYQWQFTQMEQGDCLKPSTSWLPASNPITVDRVWTQRATPGVCFHLRPVRSDDDSVWHTDVLVPSAETASQAQRYAPARVDAPIVWGMLLDLHVPSESRCSEIKGRMIDMIEANIAARGDDRKLGIYTPIDSVTGAELSGCEQSPTRDYPLEQMLADGQTARSELEPEQTRILWIFVNNIELPPSQRILEQLELFGLALLFGDEFDGRIPEDAELPIDDGDIDLVSLGSTAYTWAIGSNVFMGLFPWNVTTPWRPVQDETLRADIRSTARSTLPFATMRHASNTEVPIAAPPDADTRPVAFKICDATPFAVAAIGVRPGVALWTAEQTVQWPEFDDFPPYYQVEIPPQNLVPNAVYARRTQQVVVEVCTAFCEGPFRNRGGEDHPTWRHGSTCQWNQ